MNVEMSQDLKDLTRGFTKQKQQKLYPAFILSSSDV